MGNFKCSTIRTGIDTTTDWIGSSHGWKGNQKTPTNGTIAKTAYSLDLQERSGFSSDGLGRLCMLTAASRWNCTARSVQVMVDNVMPMRLQGRSWQQPLASLSHDAASKDALAR
jgi:hypothetical protein